MGGKAKRARHAALRDFLVAAAGALTRVSTALGALAVIATIALAVAGLHWLSGPPPPPPPPGGNGDNPRGVLYVRDLGRLPDGRHTFDLVYELVLRNATPRAFTIDFTRDRLALGDPQVGADVVALGHAPGLFGPAGPQGAITWRVALASAQDRATGLVGDYQPGSWRRHAAHYRVRARADQLADVAIGFGFRAAPRRWFAGAHSADEPAGIAHHEEVQFGAVIRARCPLGVRIAGGEVRALCAA